MNADKTKVALLRVPEDCTGYKPSTDAKPDRGARPRRDR